MCLWFRSNFVISSFQTSRKLSDRDRSDRMYEWRPFITGQLGTKRFCSARDWGNYCEWVRRPGDEREYRACVFTCWGDGCNSAPTHTPTPMVLLLLLPAVALLPGTMLWVPSFRPACTNCQLNSFSLMKGKEERIVYVTWTYKEQVDASSTAQSFRGIFFQEAQWKISCATLIGEWWNVSLSGVRLDCIVI